MSKPSAVIDKSLLHEICEVDSESERESYWKPLHERYSLIVPLALVEEVAANIANPGKIVTAVLRRMADQLIALQGHWIDDVVEIAFRELVLKRTLMTLPVPNKNVLAQSMEVLEFKSEPSELRNWAAKRKLENLETARRWKHQQDRLASSAKGDYLPSEFEFFKCTVYYEFRTALDTPGRKSEMLETILGEPFRDRHREATTAIDAAFHQYDKDTFTRFPVTLHCLLVRLRVHVRPSCQNSISNRRAAKKIIGRSAKEQANNFADEQYVVSALSCNRLLTRDTGMRNITSVFKAASIWDGQTIFLNPKHGLKTQIPRLIA